MAETERVTAAVLVIGDQILSGRTQDTNLNFIAKYLGTFGIDLAEARVVGDLKDEIIVALNHLRARYDYVITTGGIDLSLIGVANLAGILAGLLFHWAAGVPRGLPGGDPSLTFVPALEHLDRIYAARGLSAELAAVLEVAISPVFDRIADTLVDSFVRRAEQVHGQR